MQSDAKAQAEYEDPAPPSSQSPSPWYSHVSLQSIGCVLVDGEADGGDDAGNKVTLGATIVAFGVLSPVAMAS